MSEIKQGATFVQDGTKYVYTIIGWLPIDYAVKETTTDWPGVSLATDSVAINDAAAERDELIETQRAVIADLQAQLAALKAHQATVRETTQEKYCAAIVRMAKYRRLYRAARLKLAKREVNK